MACDANTLMAAAAANGYYGLDHRELKMALLQLLCSGGSGSITLAQALAYVQANATAFAQANVTFSNVLADAVAVAGGTTSLGNDGSAQFAGASVVVTAAGLVHGPASNWVLNPDGSASLASGGFQINGSGGATTSEDVEILDTVRGVILHSPNDTRYRIQVSNIGVLSAVAV